MSRTAVRAYVLATAKAAGVNPAKALWIVDHESEDCWQEGYYDPAVKGDGGKSVGCWQFNLEANPNIPYACAADLACATKLAISWIIAGKIDSWTTYRYCQLWYPDCPFLEN